MSPLSRALPLSLVLAAVLAAPAAAQGERLGTVSFPNAGDRAAQPDFLRGLALLHSFEYDDAARAFRAAQQRDPAFALAYWGEAMTYTHPLWNEQDLPAARAALARLAPTAEARAARAPTPRERDWLATAEVLYGEGPKARRDTLLARALERLVAAYPDDDEAKAFHALWLMALGQGVRDVPAYMRAGAIATELLHRKPDHPGAAHYVIHAFDDPTHAPLGLAAARAYAQIAPAADHAQHMTTHIFLALGMWDETIAQNAIAAGPDTAAWQPGHYTYWLHYALLQEGRFREAEALLGSLHAHLQAPARVGRRAYLSNARAQQVINAERWSDPSLAWAIPLDDAGAAPQAVDAFTRGFAAAMRGNRTETERRVAELGRLEGKEVGPLGGLPESVRLLRDELYAVHLRLEGKAADAMTALRDVAERSAAVPAEFGPPDFVKPPFELLGEWHLADGDLGAAQAAFTRSLALMPGRLRSLQGLVKAATAAGDREVAADAERRLRAYTGGADRGALSLDAAAR
jgi:tetratricopeptide (TPR) repeat protein